MLEKNALFVLSLRRISFFVTFGLTFLVTEFGRRIYRPYIYANDIYDFHIADTIGNFTGTMAVIFFDLALLNTTHRKGRLFLLFITLGLIGYEFAQYFSPRSVMDWRDMVATLIAGGLSLGIYELLGRRFSAERIDHVR